MSPTDATVHLDEDLAREVAQRAAERGEPPEQLVAEVLRRYFLLEVFDRIWARNPHELTEEEALALANEELDAMRAENRGDTTRQSAGVREPTSVHDAGRVDGYRGFADGSDWR